MTTVQSTRPQAAPLEEGPAPSNGKAANPAAQIPMHGGLTNEKLESALLFLHAQAAKAAATAV